MKKINSRNKGHTYERKIVKELRELGWEEAVTSRSESKRLDDAKVDICFTPPFSIQCKAQERGIFPHQELAIMPKDSNYNLLFHKLNRKGEVVSMMKEDFYELVKMLKKEKII